MMSKNLHRLIILLALIPYVIIPIMGSKLYFRHDDASLLLWSKEFNQPALQAFSTNPEVNHYAEYRGMESYWRPVTYLYIKALWHIFGTDPAPYFIIAGLFFLASIYFFFKIVEEETDVFSAVLASIFYLVAFSPGLYNIFRIGVPVGYFFQLVFLYFLYRFLKRSSWLSLAGLLLFFLPAMMRQTSALLILAFLLAAIIQDWKKKPLLSVRNITAALIFIAGIYLLKFTALVGKGGIFELLPDLKAAWSFFWERYRFYGGLLSTGLTGLIVLLFFGGRALSQILGRIGKNKRLFSSGWLLLLLVPASAVFFIKLPVVAPYWLIVCFVFLLIIDGPCRLFYFWAGISLGAFCTTSYYHQGYILEAAFPLAALMGLTGREWLGRLLPPLRAWAASRKRLAILILLPVAALLVFLMVRYRRAITEKTQTATIFVHNNQTFADLMDYLTREQPDSTWILEFREEDIGTDVRRHFSSEKRARITKIMDIKDKRNMLQVLGRGDLRIIPANLYGDPRLPHDIYFIALNSFERSLAEERYPLILVRGFKAGRESAAIYRFSRAEQQEAYH